jgi:hypothetical protein
MSQMTYVCSPLSPSILNGFGRGDFQEMEKLSHIFCGQYPLGQTVITDWVLFSVPKHHPFTMHCIYFRRLPTVFALMWWGHQGGVNLQVMHYTNVSLVPLYITSIHKA